MSKPGELEKRLRTVLKRRGMAYRTEQTYVQWYRSFVNFHGKRYPGEMGKEEVEEFLNYLAGERCVAPATQNQAFNALLFLFKQVLEIPLEGVNAMRAKEKPRLPVVLAPEEVKALLEHVEEGMPRVFLGLLYGCGLRVTEGLRLRVKDVDFPNGLVWVRKGKGDKDRALTMPRTLRAGLERQVARAQLMFEEDEEQGGARVWLEPSFDRKTGGKASRSWEWFWVFPTEKRARDPRDGEWKRHHILEGAPSKWLSKAVGRAGIAKRVTAHTLRHSYATHLLMQGRDIRTIQEALGHANVKTTEVYTHVAKAMLGRAGSPLDAL